MLVGFAWVSGGIFVVVAINRQHSFVEEEVQLYIHRRDQNIETNFGGDRHHSGIWCIFSGMFCTVCWLLRAPAPQLMIMPRGRSLSSFVLSLLSDSF